MVGFHKYTVIYDGRTLFKSMHSMKKFAYVLMFKTKRHK